MEILTLNNTVYNKNQYQRVIDTSFTQLVQPQVTTIAPTISVAEFFQNYQQIFYQIPKFGEINSHEYLIKTSQEYIGGTEPQDDLTQALINEITQLRQENLELQQLTLIPSTPTGSFTSIGGDSSGGSSFSGGSGGGGGEGY